MQEVLDTPDYTVCFLRNRRTASLAHSSQDSDTNPNTTASSVAGDAPRVDGRKRRSEAIQLRKSVFGKKLNRLDESKVRILPATTRWADFWIGG
jgi:SWI/SNF-related matrix-associated actin-dependent regulator of chromatin subfamily A member 5